MKNSMKHPGNALICIVIFVVIAFFMSGCAAFKSKKNSSQSATATGKTTRGKAAFYHDFADILIPGEMKVVEKTSFVYRTPGLSSGVISIRGRVQTNSLITFFENNMEKDNWKLISAFKSPRTMMLYQKENRWCVINISEKEFNTYAEIWVSPTAMDTESGLLK